MACIERTPRCGSVNVVGEPTSAWDVILFVITIIGFITTVVEYEKAGEVLQSIAGWLGGAAGAGFVAAALAAMATMVIIVSYYEDRCVPTGGKNQCLAGVVHNIVQNFEDGFLEELFPFTAMHNRIDLVVKSKYWDHVELNAAKVFCTDEDLASKRKSEIIRCYYYTARVCSAINGAVIGGAAGAVGGILLGALAAAAIGCATIIFCLLAILVAVVIAVAAVLIGALIGGQIGKEASDDSTPGDSSGSQISFGNLLTVNGPLFAREHDEGANVVYWVTSSAISGNVRDSVPDNPFSYCEIDEEFSMDGCPVVLDPID